MPTASPWPWTAEDTIISGHRDRQRVAASEVLRDPVHFLAFGLGSGLVPVAPGTAGTALAVLLEWPLRQLSLEVRLAIVAAAFGVGCWLCGESARRLGKHDYPGIVWDEFVGYLITMLAAPPGWGWSIAGFALFRLFDIAKPWPIRDLDHRIPGGLGIMVDDVLAGVYAAIGLWLLQMLPSQWFS